MIEILKLLGLSLLFLRFSYWVGSSLSIRETKWKRVMLSELCEGFLLLFIFSQLFGNVVILPMHMSYVVSRTGFLLIIVGVGGTFLARKQLGSAWVYAAVFKIVPKQKLVTSGVYSVVRHPIYLCVLVSYVGAEFLAGSWLWISFLFFLIPIYFQAKKEERLLAKHFGKQYADYQHRTKMLVPWIF